MLTIKEKLPEGVSLSPDLIGRAKYGFIEIKFLGVSYYVPVTLELKKILKSMGIDVPQKEPIPYNKEIQVEGFLRDLTAALYLQIRDTIGAEIHRNLSDEIKKGFETMFSDKLMGTISEQMDKKLLK